MIGSFKRYEEGEGEGRGVMCHLSQGLFPLEEGREGGREGAAEKWGAGSGGAPASSSKRRSDGSWAPGLRGEVLKTNPGINSGGTPALEPTFLNKRDRRHGGKENTAVPEQPRAGGQP